ncbi:MAG TPA: aldo/keto reductase [Candidatus Bathyarchaeia archaeon]|nr:aldo/keto reductase [Candidatus Bathyarchaeia archaeon]
MNGAIPKRPLGSTGEMVSLLTVGGFHIGLPSDFEVGVQIIRTAIDNGVNFLDNACCYHGGKSEEIMGRALKEGYREKVVLMTKNHGRDYETFKRHLELSLTRLQVDCIDVVQFHEVIEEGMPERLFKDGAVDAAVEARKEGKIRFIGFTGHKKPSIFLDMLQRNFKWDTVQLPVSVLDYHFRSFTQEIIPILVERKIGVIGMKSLAGGNAIRTGTLKAEECVRYSMSLPVSTVVVGMESLNLLKKHLKVAATFSEMSETEKSELLQRSEPFGERGEYEPYKTTKHYDSGL